MLKVVIADDEIRICQLIIALVNWESMGLEVIGTAHNGLEALDLVTAGNPDILITDIRMPGCSGLDLIEKVKEQNPLIQIIVISGYAHFEYAQQAIRFGVGDYLLKPVNKNELNGTLSKLRDQILEQRQSELGQNELQRKAEKDVSLLRKTLAEQLLEQKKIDCSPEVLKETYQLNVQPGIFQAFYLRMDCGTEELSESSVSVLMIKVREILERALRDRCFAMLAEEHGLACIGFLNYESSGTEEIRRALKLAVNQMELQKSLFHPVNFTIALGSAETQPERLTASMKEASLLIEDRILRGRGRVYERLGHPSGSGRSAVLEQYLRDMTKAVELQSTDLLKEAVQAFTHDLLAVRDIRGYEVLESTDSAAEMFAVKTQMSDRISFLETFRTRSRLLGDADLLAEFLESQLCGYLEQLTRDQENESVRPVRKAKQYIQEHYSEPITQEEVSSAVGLSSTYFSVLFKKVEGEGFAKYLIAVRMEKAKEILRESNSSVAEVCRMVGYNDVKHFTHTFEKTVGVKPAVYRKLYG